MTNMSRSILIVGGGPAGAVTAFWLAKAAFKVTIAERSTSRFTYGQGVDITGPPIEIIKKMGLYDTIKANTTGETGSALANDIGEPIAIIGAAPQDNSTASWVQEIEIMRGKCTEIFSKAATSFSNVTYRYGCTVEELREGERSVTAKLSDTGEPEEFAAVIGADGLRSRVRSLVFDEETNKKCLDPKDVYVGFFSIKGDSDHDIPNSRLQNAPGGRSILIRPIDRNGDRSSCYVMAVGEHEPLQKVSEPGHTSEEQKATLLERFADFPGLGDRARRGVREDADDFYFTRIVQVKLDSWHNGRCALVGDAAYAPSPLTGQGTTLSILGSYILAGEMAKSPEDPASAFVEYEKKLQEYVREEQKIPFGGRAPYMANPQTRMGISVSRTLFWVLAKSQAWKWFNVGMDKKFALPEYPFGDS
ncbi:oxidoreductase [Hortaea werneckii]|nr:oxidoreductase [Hortaea werneckii]